MIFKENKKIEYIGKKMGFLFSYALFTITLFFILNFTKKIPDSWTILHVVAITFIITLIGVLLKKLLK